MHGLAVVDDLWLRAWSRTVETTNPAEFQANTAFNLSKYGSLAMVARTLMSISGTLSVVGTSALFALGTMFWMISRLYIQPAREMKRVNKTTMTPERISECSNIEPEACA
ncbi:hypothetical protein H257_04787 [Aphanomyces astaci]|uniref:Uncharacterized protein n=1 Tax=Aphanomyces astaci TaxID=112090 RepID=W4GVJ8_APHAT|nr:hypothetical protein H257_04787 [Aphanomyces astaci]ETV83044.1 hypothetical protein H257_04787 [Aphanomyces astaci]|eukprot:XP_009827715.1 hypothetical protein H257_04787 [Aphanomyces astaci]